VDQFVSDKLDSRGYEAALVDINLSSTPDPDPYPFWDQGQITGGQNYSQWNDRTVSDTLEQARVATSLSERTRLYHNFQYLFADQLPALPLYYPVYNYAVDAQVQGISIGPLFSTSDRFANVSAWWMVSQRTATDSN
jgi:peptide/nickel transport system substrate-binding protein